MLYVSKDAGIYALYKKNILELFNISFMGPASINKSEPL